MSLNIPLAVRLKTASADRHVTRDLRDLTFRSVAPGGFASATIVLDRPLSTQPGEIDYYGTAYVYDKRSGAVVWEGRMEDPGRTAADGQTWRVTAVGGAAHAQDRIVPLIYADRSMNDGWVRADNATAPHATVSVTGDPGSSGRTQAIVIQIPGGTALTTGDAAQWQYTRVTDAGQKVARLEFDWDANSNAVFSVKAWVTGGGTTILLATPFNNAGGSLAARITADFPSGRDTVNLFGQYTGVGANPTIVNWCSFKNVLILAVRVDATGADITTAASYTASGVLASDVVTDLLGRLLPKFDGTHASIATTSTVLDSVAYPEGVTPATLLDDLMLLEPGYFWAAWESNASGLYRFEWSAWPTTVRYEATTVDGFDSPGSAVDLYNAVRVRYIDTNSNLATIQRTQTVAALTAAGLTREGLLDLTTSQGRHSLTTAQRAGDQWLAQRATPPNAGTLTVARPIRDLTTGALIQPWEIRPGNLIRVRGVLPRVDALNPTARDGVTIFRVSAVEFQASSASARLELDSYPRSVARALALLGKHR